RRALPRGDPADAGRVRARRGRGARAALVRAGHGALRRDARGDARVRDEGARAPAQGDRAGARRLTGLARATPARLAAPPRPRAAPAGPAAPVTARLPASSAAAAGIASYR